MGADAGAAVLARGALDAACARADLHLTFFGAAAELAPLLRNTSHEVVDAPRCLRPGDSLRRALRGADPSSMRAAIGAVAGGSADAVMSAGSTGALMALARHALGMIQGIKRPAIGKTLAREDGLFFMLDLGANVGVGPAELHQFAHMGTAMAHAVEDVAAPTVGLLNIGSEVHKGPPDVRAAAALLDADPALRYAGFVEPDRLFGSGIADVVVTDGFAGNIALKSAEGAARMAAYLLHRELTGGGLGTQLAKAKLRDRLKRVRSAYNPQLYNGAALIGLKRVVVKSHGAADREGFASALAQTAKALATGVVDKVAAAI